MAPISSTRSGRRWRESVFAATATVLLHGLALWLVFHHKTEAPFEAARILEVSLLAALAPPAPAPPAPPTEQRAEPAPEAPPTPPKPAKPTRPLAVKRPLTPAPRAVATTAAAQPRPATAPSSADALATSKAPGEAGEAEVPFVAPRFDAAYFNNPPPPYPPLSRRLGEQGRVMVRVFVDTSGAPAQIELRESSGHPRLDDAAASAVRRWRFVPARRGSEPVGAWVLVPISFNLRS
jgi:protein TonB